MTNIMDGHTEEDTNTLVVAWREMAEDETLQKKSNPEQLAALVQYGTKVNVFNSSSASL